MKTNDFFNRKLIIEIIPSVTTYLNKRIPLLSILFLSIASTPIVMYVKLRCYNYAIYMTFLAFLLSSLITLTTTLRDDVLFKFTRVIIVTIIIYINIIYVFGLVHHGLTLPIDSISFIAQTNAQEAIEYLLEKTMPLYISILFVASFLFYAFIKKYIWNLKEINNKPILIVALIALFFISSAAIIHNPDTIRTFKGLNNINLLVENSVDLREHLTHPTITEEIQDHPDNIVLIIGESFSKYHSSLYGYKKETNPGLNNYYKNGDLVVFDSIESPCTSTTPTFKYILNTNTRSKKQNWYECTTIQEAFSTIGYRTYWISNQQEHGIWNNISSGQSLICDESHFNGAEGETFDFCVVDTYKKLKITNKKNFFFFHLYGQHPQFYKRYPKEFAKFKQSDYIDKLENQRETLAAYDNATYYNDYVVSSIIKCFEDEDALIIYFSDHGLDLFYVDDKYCAHGRPTIDKSDKMGRAIPFFVYLSKKFKQNHPDKVQFIESEKSIPFCTENLIYKLLSYTGYILQ